MKRLIVFLLLALLPCYALASYLCEENLLTLPKISTQDTNAGESIAQAYSQLFDLYLNLVENKISLIQHYLDLEEASQESLDLYFEINQGTDSAIVQLRYALQTLRSLVPSERSDRQILLQELTSFWRDRLTRIQVDLSNQVLVRESQAIQSISYHDLLERVGLIGPTLSPDGKYFYFISPRYQGFEIWDTSTGTLVASKKTRTESFYQLAVSPDGKQFLTSSTNNQFQSFITIWELGNENPVSQLSELGNFLYSPEFRFSDDSSLVALWDSKKINFLDLPSKNLRETFIAENYVNNFTFDLAPDNQSFLTNGKGYRTSTTVRNDFSPRTWQDYLWRRFASVFKLNTALEVERAIEHRIDFNRFTADGNYIVRNNKKGFEILDRWTGASLGIESGEDLLSNIYITPDRRHLIAQNLSSKEVQIWELSWFRQIYSAPAKSLVSEFDPSHCWKMSADGNYLLDSSDKKTITIWNIRERSFAGVIEAAVEGFSIEDYALSSDRYQITVVLVSTLSTGEKKRIIRTYNTLQFRARGDIENGFFEGMSP